MEKANQPETITDWLGQISYRPTVPVTFKCMDVRNTVYLHKPNTYTGERLLHFTNKSLFNH